MRYFFLVCILSFQWLSAQVFINELMADNSSTLNDVFGQSSDWIELYNEADTAVNLLNWYISDKPGNPQYYRFPDISIPAQGFLLIYASARNINLPIQLHLSFRLDADGEQLVLSRPDGQIEDVLVFPALGIDISYGLRSDGGNHEVSFIQATPGYSNALGDTLIPQTWQLSHPSGYYTESFNLELAGSLPANATIHYTLNGEDPTLESPQFPASLTFSGANLPEAEIAYIPTGIGWHLPKEVNTAHTFKAQVFLNGEAIGPIMHRTFFMFPKGAEAYSLPVVSIQSPPRNFFGNDEGIYVIGNNENYYNRGTAWEREVFVEFFDTDGQQQFAQYAGARIYGGTSRIKPQKSLKLFARKKYGNNHFDYPFFGSDYDDQFQRIVLRSLVTDWGPSAMTDDMIQEIIYQKGGGDFESIRRSYAIVFINGEYWGIHSLREDFNDEYVERKFGIDEDDVQTMNQDFFNLLDFIVEEDMRKPNIYQQVANQIDLPAFIDYMATELFFANIDWPRLNYLFWRERGVSKWRPVFYDLDGACKVYNENMLQYVYEIERYHSPQHEEGYLLVVLGSLLQNESFRQDFTLKLVELIQYTFTPDFTTKVQNELIQVLEPEMQEHIERWSYPKSYRKWQSATDKVRDFLFMRPEWLLGLTFNLFDYPIDAYPNPINQGQMLTISMEALADEVVEVQVVSVDQKVQSLGQYTVAPGNNVLQITTTSLAPGFYVLAIQGERLYFFEKLIVQ